MARQLYLCLLTFLIVTISAVTVAFRWQSDGCKSSEVNETAPVTKWNVIACIACRMEAHNIREWIVWNHLAGIEHFVIFNNNDLSPEGQYDGISHAVEFFVRRGIVTLLPGYKDVMNNASLADVYHLEPPFDRPFYETLNLNIDNPLKQRCWEMYKQRAHWIAFFDTDEYFTPIKPNFTLKQMLEWFPNKAGVGIFWKIASYSGHFLRPADGSIRHYKLCRFHPSNRHIKTIAQPQLIEGVSNAHYLNYPAQTTGCVTDDGTSTGCNVSNLGRQDWFPSSRYFQLNHYFSRSMEEFTIKSLRGIYFNSKVDYFRRDFPQHSDCDLLDVDKPTENMALRVQTQMAEWHLHQWPLKGPSTLSSASAPEGFMQILMDAVQERKVWNESYYLAANADNANCLPPPPRDGLVHYWLAGAPSSCKIRFD